MHGSPVNKRSRSLLVLVLFVTAVAAISVAGLSSRPESGALGIAPAADPIDTPSLEPHPLQGCSTGCAAVPESSGALPPFEIRRCLQGVATQAVGVASIELETLLFHAHDVRAYTRRHGFAPLAGTHATFLQNQLKMRKADVRIRVIDEAGVERISFAQAVPIGEKQHLHADDATDITPPELSFTVQRVGLYHLWTRI
jgi:hypothetical protein